MFAAFIVGKCRDAEQALVEHRLAGARAADHEPEHRAEAPILSIQTICIKLSV
jgi:hypothetical protein